MTFNKVTGTTVISRLLLPNRTRRSTALYDKVDSLSINEKVEFLEVVNFKGSKMENVKITSGEINGNSFDVDIRNINIKSLTLSTLRESKTHLDDALVIASNDGSLISLNISLEDGWIRDTKISGSLDLRGKHIDSVEGREIPGKILGASIEGGSNKEVRHLSVSGLTHIENNLDEVMHSLIVISVGK